MRVLHVVESLDRGGLERVVVDLALAQHAAGHDIAVFCLFRLGQLARELGAAGIRVCAADKRPRFDVRVVGRLHAEIRRIDAEVLHTHNAVANYYGALAALLHPRLRLVNSRHGMGAVNADGRKELFFRLSLLRTAAVALVCARAIDHFAAHRVVPRSLARMVHNGIRVENFAPRSHATRAAARAGLGISGDAFVAGTVGRLNWAKDQALMIQSFALMQPRRPEDRLVIVGEGELRAQLEAEIRDRGLGTAVLLLGDRGDVPALLPAFDVFVATSVTEGYSIALLEAAAAGIPVVAGDVGGNAEIVQHGSTGVMVSERTAAQFARSLGELAAAPDICEQMGRAARAWAEKHASLAETVRAYERLYARESSIPLRSSTA